MDDTQTETPPPPPDDGFRSDGVRTITDVQRSTADPLLGGVCSGVARHLNIDPVVVRIGLVALSVLGGAGIILYVAAWFLLPPDDGRRSVAAEWFNLDDSEERVRVGGLVLAGVIAVLSVVGDSGWGWGGGGWWILVPLGLLLALVVLPRQRRQRREAAERTEGTAAPSVLGTARSRTPRPRRSRALTGLTLSVMAIALAVTRLVAEANDGTPWTTYVAVSLTVVGLGLLVATLWGHGGPLYLLGALLAVTLVIGSAMPSPRVGQQDISPTSAAEVRSTYRHGLGQLTVDLASVSEPGELVGRTVSVEAGVGHTRVVVPDGVNVVVDAELDLGEVRVFDKRTSGNDLRLTESQDADPDAADRRLRIDVEQNIGQIEVISQ